MYFCLLFDSEWLLRDGFIWGGLLYFETNGFFEGELVRRYDLVRQCIRYINVLFYMRCQSVQCQVHSVLRRHQIFLQHAGFITNSVSYLLAIFWKMCAANYDLVLQITKRPTVSSSRCGRLEIHFRILESIFLELLARTRTNRHTLAIFPNIKTNLRRTVLIDFVARRLTIRMFIEPPMTCCMHVICRNKQPSLFSRIGWITKPCGSVHLKTFVL